MIDPAAIEQSALARAVATGPLLYPVINTVHLLAIATLFGSILAVDLRLARLLGERLDPALPTLTRIALAGFVLAAASGALLALSNLGEYVTNPAFLVKLGLIACAGAVAAAYACGLWRNTLWPGLLSLALWTGVIAAGRFIAFVP